MSDSDDSPRPRKDRLIQTRVARDLETTLKEEAQRRRLTVSHLIRSVLEDTFQLVDDVVADVDEIVGDSARLARNVGRNARRLMNVARDERDHEAPTNQSFPDVYAWNELVLNRSVVCAECGVRIAKGERGFFGMSDPGAASQTCLCTPCGKALHSS